ncbi:uncharacterized protein IUM83_01507 [Phytophthora cinnamomi]|uniref:uncharacterized protein n=1 Tax=Phytophthora cinnamomi TaxID=4785 RepID=UPI00355945F6|nr:hypothetical protein IUM83_01507 [Phytophthora cinnamomi]
MPVAVSAAIAASNPPTNQSKTKKTAVHTPFRSLAAWGLFQQQQQNRDPAVEKDAGPAASLRTLSCDGRNCDAAGMSGPEASASRPPRVAVAWRGAR